MCNTLEACRLEQAGSLSSDGGTRASHIVFRRAAMFRYEIARIQSAVCFFAVTGADERRDEFAHFKMQMSEILTVSRANGCDLLAAAHIIPRRHQNLVAMAIIRLHVAAGTVFLDCMQDNDDIAPARSSIAREQNAAISHGVNRIAEVGIFSADSVEIVTEMMIFGETLRVIRQRAVLAAERKIEAGRDWK